MRSCKVITIFVGASNMKHICPECHGNGYIAVDINDNGTGAVYDDCPCCHGLGEINEELMEAHQTQRKLGE